MERSSTADEALLLLRLQRTASTDIAPVTMPCHYLKIAAFAYSHVLMARVKDPHACGAIEAWHQGMGLTSVSALHISATHESKAVDNGPDVLAPGERKNVLHISGSSDLCPWV